MLDIKKISELRSEYIAQWEVSAQHFEKQNYYKWMSSFLDGYDKVLEVGTGSGTGTKALIESGHKVISIDENPNCLDVAQTKLERDGFKVLRFNRETLNLDMPFSYSVQYSAIQTVDSNYDAILLQADIANDPKLYEWLKTQNIDAVTCWLIGSHGARSFNSYLQENGKPQTPAHYRILTQNRVYEVADEILSKGKVLHIVDRGVELDDFQRAQLIQCHEDQASVTTLKVINIDSLAYEESRDSSAMSMMVTNQATGEVIEKPKLAFSSVLTQKS
ncbi:class I SAM-dependent methyltransferase [Vibrio vulnificus]|nr:class I SAM-dependent methyltransferase [Vibrio vulnificus]MCU8510284.1 class I SAM-dependent methyltransferase [Vibrio vulnificus]